MIDHITGTYGLSPEDAYLLASLCVDLKISEIVDAGQYVEEFDDETPPINILRRTAPTSPRTVLTNSFGFGGTNACLVLRRFDG